MTVAIDKIPHSQQTEKNIIGTAILDGTIQGNLLDVATTDFYIADYQTIWSAINDLYEEQRTFSIVDIWQRVKDAPRFNLTMSDITNLTRDNGAIVTAHAKHNVRYLQELAVKRQTLRNLNQLQIELDNLSLAEIASRIEAINQTISSAKSETNNFQSMHEVMTKEVYPRLDKFVKNESNRIRTGFESIDDATLDGIGMSELWIIAALTSEGKSAFALQMARQIAQQGIAVACISREMLNYENGFRALAQYGQFSNGFFRVGLHEKTATQLKELGQDLEVLPLYFDDKSSNLRDIKKNLTSLITQFDVKVVVVDYLQLIQSTGKENRQSKLEEIINELKNFAMQKEVAVVVLSQFNREANKIDGMPKISDLDGASAIEKAGNVILLWKLEKDVESEIIEGTNRDKTFIRGNMKIAKGRHTAKSEFGMKFYNAETRFEVY